MQALSTSALLDAWERGLGTSLVQRALTLLAAACHDLSPDHLARLSIGQRDARLLTLRTMIFGAQVHAVAQCLRCGARLDLAFNVDDTRASAPVERDGLNDDTVTVAFDGRVGRFRLPNSLDLAAVTSERDLARARTLLLRRCAVSVTCDGAAASVDDAPAGLLDAAVEQMAQIDAQADVDVSFTCPSCGDRRAVAFDIASFFWAEVDAWAARTLADVHTLAKTYGWRESEILEMHPRRRQRYLDLVG